VTTLHSDPRVRYAAAVLLNSQADAFELPAWLSYGDASSVPAGSRVHIVASGFFGDAYGTLGSLPVLPPAMLDHVPVLFGAPLVERQGDTVLIHADVVAAAYFLTTRYEEWVRPDVRDDHGRFPGVQSFAARAGFIDRPVVDDYASLLRGWAGQAGITVPPPARQFSVLLTHDVDSIGWPRGLVPVMKAVARGLAGRASARETLRAVSWAAGLQRHPHDNLSDVIALDAQVIDAAGPDRCRAMYFFQAHGTTPHDGKYRLGTRRTRRWLSQVAAAGAAIGLHASYAAGDTPMRIASERQALAKVTGRPIEANRHHFLRWCEPAQGAAIHDAGIRWDSTLGFADLAGFRLGVCRPIALFDPAARRLVGIEEHPLIVMDCTLDREKYMNLDEARAFQHVCQLAETVRRHRGEFVMLWHNTELVPSDTNYHNRLYSRILAHLAPMLRCA